MQLTDKERYVFQCTITDTGCGIAGQKTSALFKPFEQVIDDSGNRNTQGTGLGLTISQKLYELMSGDISVETELGMGSAFNFRVELYKADSQPSGLTNTNSNNATVKKQVSSLSDTKVLVVEDNEINQLIVCDMLKNLGVRFFVAEDGEEAIALLRRKPKIDVILMDCLMPRMDGYKATELIRTEPELAKYRDVAVIALTANAVVGDREKCLSHGMTDYMKKPVEKELLASMLVKYASIAS